MKTLDIVKHILDTADVALIYYGEREVGPEELEKLTDGHYTGNGVVIEFDTYDGISEDTKSVVFTTAGKYLGTRSENYFNDVNSNWNYDTPTKEI